MNASTPKDSLELEVANFGPIVEARIDLRPLTVFVGPSNTGKSYLAILIYALHRFFSGNIWATPFRVEPSKKEIDALAEWARQISPERSSSPIEGEDRLLPGAVTCIIRSLFTAHGHQLEGEISRCFGIEKKGQLIRKGSRGGAQVVFRTHAWNCADPFKHELTLKARRAEFETTVPEEGPVLAPISAEELAGYERVGTTDFFSIEGQTDPKRVSSAQRVAYFLFALVLPQLVRPLHRPAFYLPADRTGVMHAHRVVVSNMLRSASMTGPRPAAGPPTLSGVLADFLQQLIDLDHPPYGGSLYGSDSPANGIDRQLEEAMLGGSVRVNKSEMIGYPHFTYQPRGWKNALPLINASSMVSELAPVVLFLRHKVSQDTLLIIEEPESHLHPAMQVEFTRQIAALVHAGVRVIVTTHSEWVLEELGNIVRRSELPKGRRKEIPRGEFALRSDQVGAWLFEPKGRPKGSIVKEIRLDDSGLFPSKFDEVARVLHNDWADISSWIGGAA